MQITSIPPVLPATSANKSTAQPQTTADKQKADAQAPKRNGPLQPTPPLRPTLQDKVEMTLALLTLREV